MFWLLVVGFGLLSLAHIAPFPFLLDAVGPAPALWRMPRGEGAPTVYLTFDDGPNPTATPPLLDVLAEHRVEATFFVIDRHVTAETAPIVRRMFREGHKVGLHSHTRALMTMAPSDLAIHLTDVANRIEQLTGHRPCRAFRPHAGWRSGQMFAGLAEIDHVLVGWGWTLWDFNWYRPPDPEGLAVRLAAKVTGGDIVVMHDGHHVDPRADRGHTVEAASIMIPTLRADGYIFGTVC